MSGKEADIFQVSCEGLEPQAVFWRRLSNVLRPSKGVHDRPDRLGQF